MKPNNDLFRLLGAGFLIGVFTTATIALIWNHNREPRRHFTTSTLQSSATATAPAAPVSTGSSALNSTVSPMLEPAVARVAARFACSCGTCGEKRLDVCSCETAQAERAFIQEQLRNGHTEAEAAEALKQKYGGLKS